MSRTQLLSVALVAGLLGATSARAQEAEAPPQEPAAEAPAAEATEPPAAAAEEDTAPAAAEGEAAPAQTEPPTPPPQVAPQPAPPAARTYARPRTPPPIMVVVVPGDRVSEEVTAAAREALVAQITPLAPGRAVHGLGVAEMVAALSACTEDTCIGAQLASAGAQAGVLLRLTRRGRQLSAALEVRDPVSGTSRTEAPIEARFAHEVAALAEPIQQMSAQLASAMPSPPLPNPTLLITTTQDGALVTVDGEDIGESPVSAIEIADGSHEIVVRLAGYSSYRTETQITPGERARVDASLSSLTASEDGAPADPNNPFAQTDQSDDDLLGQWWFWTIIGGGAAVVIGVVIGVAIAVADSNSQPPVPMMPTGIPLPPITGGM